MTVKYEILGMIGARIKAREEANLAFFMENLMISLAEDLEWALSRLDASPQPSDEDNALQYVKARSHLRTQKAYREACGKVA